MTASYEAIAADRRAHPLGARKSFATETVFSHPSKLDLIAEAQAIGYIVIVMHVGVDSPDLSVARVQPARGKADTMSRWRRSMTV